MCVHSCSRLRNSRVRATSSPGLLREKPWGRGWGPREHKNKTRGNWGEEGRLSSLPLPSFFPPPLDLFSQITRSYFRVPFTVVSSLLSESLDRDTLVRPVSDSILKHELSNEYKAVSCPRSKTNGVHTQEPHAHFCARVQGLDLSFGRRPASPLNSIAWYLKKGCVQQVAYSSNTPG